MAAELTPSNGKRPVVLAEIRHDDALHPAWAAFLEYCRKLGYGEIERLKIQDGLPVLAEMVQKKVKFT